MMGNSKAMQMLLSAAVPGSASWLFRLCLMSKPWKSEGKAFPKHHHHQCKIKHNPTQSLQDFG